MDEFLDEPPELLPPLPLPPPPPENGLNPKLGINPDRPPPPPPPPVELFDDPLVEFPPEFVELSDPPPNPGIEGTLGFFCFFFFFFFFLPFLGFFLGFLGFFFFLEISSSNSSIDPSILVSPVPTSGELAKDATLLIKDGMVFMFH